VKERDWIHPDERMDEPTLRLALTEKRWGVAKAEESLRAIDSARAVLRPDDYRDLHALFERTLLTARLHAAVAEAYYGSRIWSRGGAFRTPTVARTIQHGLAGIDTVATAMRTYPDPPPVGQWAWAKDADAAMGYREKIERQLRVAGSEY
jgi:hypothetical protein